MRYLIMLINNEYTQFRLSCARQRAAARYMLNNLDTFAAYADIFKDAVPVWREMQVRRLPLPM